MAQPVPKHLRSRLLYPNPVCILTTVGATGERNAMVVSWLTPVDNRGALFLSMNARRHSAALLRDTGIFSALFDALHVAAPPVTRFPLRAALSVPTRGLEDVLRRIGGCHGPQRGQPKLVALGVRTCAPGWAGDPAPNVPEAVSDCVAHLVCRARLDSLREEGGHLTVFADTEEAFVQPTHWDGKRFLPVTPGAPPVLTFFGSGTFGYAVPAEAATGDAAADAPL